MFCWLWQQQIVIIFEFDHACSAAPVVAEPPQIMT
jgi:hypothetical protein